MEEEFHDFAEFVMEFLDGFLDWLLWEILLPATALVMTTTIMVVVLMMTSPFILIELWRQRKLTFGATHY
ncbi:MAG: hypothetical protein COV07_02290 [Candidatus Vogelbacteria bacterium CG10_big_fil_rev_8_21_14_0_10_45_14]|uniref:Uncharacterized protein n=1 Tax=Candidatus Vogelbacteria bacterium CG10_big_fil_rev_8_21_14_0_10_45_14 TaxID=1975042 RepID=A0A2H0RJZ9_9BACT|nr:MAG: hypothetical protein COV07_02290 [Candidatus Vogelbacteria bacterium CG10_big_fil_rev_8_21_14_0_10_45_14]